MTRTELLTELRRIVTAFRARGKHHSAAQWQRVVDRVNGRKTISDAELAAWRDKAVANGWKTGAEWLPKAIAWLATVAEPEDAGETDDEIDELGKRPSSYDEMDEPTLRGYLGVARGADMPLALARLEAEIAEREADTPPKADPWDRGDESDVDWKDSDTFGKGRQGVNVRFVSAGGYREYVLALEKDKDAAGNRGKAIAGHVQNQLASEIVYLHGRNPRGANYGGEKTRREIQRKYGLPCWGSLNAEAHGAFSKELSAIGSETTKAAWAEFREARGLAGADRDDDWWEHPDWKSWSEAHGYLAYRRLRNAHVGNISGGRNFFNEWVGSLKQAFKDAAGPEYHARIDALDAHLPLRYYMENGLEPPAPPARERTADDIREDMADAQAAGDWDALAALAAEMKALG